MGFRLLGPQILMKQDKEVVKEKTEGGIYLPSTEVKKEEQFTAVITHLGETFATMEDKDIPFKVGDKVIYSQYDVKPITIEGVEYLMCTEPAIVIILDNV